MKPDHKDPQAHGVMSVQRDQRDHEERTAHRVSPDHVDSPDQLVKQALQAHLDQQVRQDHRVHRASAESQAPPEQTVSLRKACFQ